MKNNKFNFLIVSALAGAILLLQSFVRFNNSDNVFGADKKNRIITLYVNNNNIIDDNYLGVNAVYHGFAFIPENSKTYLNDQDRANEFAHVASMNLKIARTMYRPTWACNSNIYNQFNWETDRMHGFYKWLDEMKKLNVTVALQAGWQFPDDTYYGNKTPDSTKDPERYAEWVNESLYQLIKVRNYTNIKYLMLFTEPLRDRFNKIPNPYIQPPYYAKVCQAINNKLVQSGMRSYVKLVGPDIGSTDTAAFVGWATNTLNNVIDIYSWHSYNGGNGGNVKPLEYDAWVNIVNAGKVKVAKTHKPFWMDEYGAFKPDETVRFKPDYGNYLAQCVAAFTNTGAQTSLLWLLFDQKYEGKYSSSDSFYNGVQRWGLVTNPEDNVPNPGAIRPAWYAFSMMSRFLGDRTKTAVFKTTNANGLIIVVTKSADNQYTVMVINSTYSNQQFQVKFANNLNCDLNRYLYDPATITSLQNTDHLNISKKISQVQNIFSDDIASRGVSIYTTGSY